MADEGSFCAPCAMFRVYCASGGPEQNQHRQRLAHPKRLLCPISVQRQADWEAVFSAAQRSDAAGTRLVGPRTAIYADGAENKLSVLSKKDKAALRFLGFTSCCHRGVDTTAFIVVEARRSDSFYFRCGGDRSPLDVYNIIL